MPAKSSIPAGQKFGILTIQHEAEPRQGRRHFACVCDCGTEVTVSLSNLRTGNSTSCGCLFRQGREEVNRRRFEEGYRNHPLRSLHNGVVRRCTDPKHKDYPRYGGAGIRLWGPWRSRGRFIPDVEQEIGPRPSLHHSIDRIDPRGDYAPGNIRWATPLEQKHNQRTAWRFISRDEAEAIRQRYAVGGISQQQVAVEFSTTQKEVSRVVNRQGRYARS
jgi:hypothetical protein